MAGLEEVFRPRKRAQKSREIRYKFVQIREQFRPALAALRFQAAGAHFDHGRGVRDLDKQRRIGAGHPDLRAELVKFGVQCRAPVGIEMRHHLVEQQHGRRAGHLGDQSRMRQDEPDEQRFLFAGRSVGGGMSLGV